MTPRSVHRTKPARATGSAFPACSRIAASARNLFNVFLGVSVVSALAAGFFYWKGYASAGKSTSKESSDGSVGRIRINPSIGPGHVGAGISLEF